MVEWFWVNNFVRDGDQFRGAINNVPRSVRTVREGQDVRFTRSDIVDWMYMHDGRLKGGFTSCALLNKDPNVQARTALIGSSAWIVRSKKGRRTASAEKPGRAGPQPAR